MNNETTNLDVRYQFMTTDGAAIFVYGTGITYANNVIHGHLKFQTGSPKYYWMNSAHGRFYAPSSYVAMKEKKKKMTTDAKSAYRYWCWKCDTCAQRLSYKHWCLHGLLALILGFYNTKSLCRLQANSLLHKQLSEDLPNILRVKVCT
jgi:hypothetical protein